MDNFVGKRLDGRYEIQEIIGVGGMSVVYKAYDRIDDRIVAVKILKSEFVANEDFRRRFKNESKAIAVLNHPNIVRVYDVNFGERLQYIVMEYVDGITLKEYIQHQGVVNWRDAVHFVIQILRALQHAHDKGIVHRDIKPQNIVLLQNGTIKVTDFGIARFSRSDTRTMTEKAIGSVHYISPEQARGDLTDEKADIYSVGVVLYEMITGKVPFDADSAVSVAIMQLQADPEMPCKINPSIPKGLEQITMHAMKKLPADRYQTATEMLLDIKELNRNPNATFDYSFFVDNQPTKFVPSTGELYKSDSHINADDYYDDDEYYDGSDDDYYYDGEESYSDAEKEKKKKMIAAIAGGSVAAIALIVMLVLFLTGTIGGSKIPVPDFTNKVFETEIQGKYSDQFEFQIVNEESTFKEGSVLRQEPAAGEKVKKGSKIILYVAVSSEKVSIPSLAGKTLDEAIAILNSMNFKNYEPVGTASEDVDKNKVIRTSPDYGESISLADKITIYYSTGSEKEETEKVEVPSIDGLSKSDIEKVLKGSGLSVSITEEDSELPAGSIISMSPKANEKVEKGTTVKVVLSNGKKPTEASKETTIAVFCPNDSTLQGKKLNVIIYFDGMIQRESVMTVKAGTGWKATFNTASATNKVTGTKQVTVTIEGTDFEKTLPVDFDKGGIFQFDASSAKADLDEEDTGAAG